MQTIIEADGTRRTLERNARGRALRLTAATRPQARPAARLTTVRAKATGQDEPPPGGYPDDPGAYDYIYVWTYATLSSNPLYFERTLFDGLDLPEEPNVEGSIGGGSLETRSQCIARHIFSCDLVFYACLITVVGAGVAFGATCTLATFIFGLPACSVITGIIGLAGATACLLNGIACANNAADGCPP